MIPLDISQALPPTRWERIDAWLCEGIDRRGPLVIAALLCALLAVAVPVWIHRSFDSQHPTSTLGVGLARCDEIGGCTPASPPSVF